MVPTAASGSPRPVWWVFRGLIRANTSTSGTGHKGTTSRPRPALLPVLTLEHARPGRETRPAHDVDMRAIRRGRVRARQYRARGICRAVHASSTRWAATSRCCHSRPTHYGALALLVTTNPHFRPPLVSCGDDRRRGHPISSSASRADCRRPSRLVHRQLARCASLWFLSTTSACCRRRRPRATTRPWSRRAPRARSARINRRSRAASTFRFSSLLARRVSPAPTSSRSLHAKSRRQPLCLAVRVTATKGNSHLFWDRLLMVRHYQRDPRPRVSSADSAGTRGEKLRAAGRPA